MTDRELLDLAAKAAGLRLHEKGNADRARYYPEVAALYVFDELGRINTGWNPLDNDGDALRLAVKLEINPKWLEGKAWAWAVGKSAICCTEPLGNDPYAATRRAIVRAAAEIGKQRRDKQ